MKKMKRFFGNKNFLVGFILSAVVLGMALTSLVWTPYDANSMNPRHRLESSSFHHPSCLLIYYLHFSIHHYIFFVFLK